MKKLIFLPCILLSIAIYAQTPYDALKFIQNDISGSARYVSMAGAFGALGGDATAIKDNPAGLGIFRKSELTTTIDILSQKSSSTWNKNSEDNDLFKMGFNNFSYILSVPTWRNETGKSGLKYSNWSFSFNQLKNFNRRLYIKANDLNASITDYLGYFTNGTTTDQYDSNNYPTADYNTPWDNTSLSWLSIMAVNAGLINEFTDQKGNYWSSFLNEGEKISPSYTLEEAGSLNEYSIGWSGNFNNSLFLGVNANLQTLDYTLNSTYTESFEQGVIGLNNIMTTSGAGVNLKVGAIYAPVDFVRLGLAFHTPTLFVLSDMGSSDLSYNISTNRDYIQTPNNTLDYQLSDPFQANASIGFILGKKALLSAEYVYKNYTEARFYDKEGKAIDYIGENIRVKNYLNDTRLIKFGGEYKLRENIALRIGYANENNSVDPKSPKYMIPTTTRGNTEYMINNSTNYFSAGIGYRESGWYIDFGYIKKVIDDTFMPFDPSAISNASLKPTSASVTTSNDNLVFTFGLRF